MRVRTFHRHTVSRSSVFLGALVLVHFAFSFIVTIPILSACTGVLWRRDELSYSSKAWFVCIMIIFSVVEVVRFILGGFANRKLFLADIIGYMSLSVFPQLPLVWLYFGLVPQRNDVEYSLCVTQVILLLLEVLAAIRLIWRVARNSTVDYYVHLGSTFQYG